MSMFQRNPIMRTAVDRGQLVRDLLGGTQGMINAGQLHLKKYTYEETKDYDARLQSGLLYNGYRRTRGYLTGQAFSRNVTLSDDSPQKDAFNSIMENADLQGNNLRTWAQMAFEDGIDDGMVGVMIDFPRIGTQEIDGQLYYYDEAAETWALKSREVDDRNGWRPFFTIIKQQQILGYRFEVTGGLKRLIELRLLETELLRRGITDVEDEYVEQVRILRPGAWEVWRRTDVNKMDSAAFLYDQGRISMDIVPVVFFSPGERYGDLACFPALEDLAEINRRHWVCMCDQNSMMSYVRRPPWLGKMLQVNELGQIEFSPGRLVNTTDPSGDLRSIGLDSSAVSAGMQEITTLEAKMAMYGLHTLQPGYSGGAKTAFQSQTEVSESTSWLKDVVLGFRDMLENAFGIAAMWMGIAFEDAPHVKMNTEFNGAYGLDAQTLIQAVGAKLLPKQLVIEELARRGMISDAWEWQDIQAMLLDEERYVEGPSGSMKLDIK